VLETAAVGAMIQGMTRVSGVSEIENKDLNSRGGKRSGLIKAWLAMVKMVMEALAVVLYVSGGKRVRPHAM
jgi:hypothetical protein